MIKTYDIQRLVDKCGASTNIKAVRIAADLMELDMFSRVKYLSDEIFAALALYDVDVNKILNTYCDHPSVKTIYDLIDGRPSPAQTFVRLCRHLATKDYL